MLAVILTHGICFHSHFVTALVPSSSRSRHELSAQRLAAPGPPRALLMLMLIPTAVCARGFGGLFLFSFFPVSLGTIAPTPHALQDTFHVGFFSRVRRKCKYLSLPVTHVLPGLPSTASPLVVCPIAGSCEEHIWEFAQLLKKGTFNHEMPENIAGNCACSTLTSKDIHVIHLGIKA